MEQLHFAEVHFNSPFQAFTFSLSAAGIGSRSSRCAACEPRPARSVTHQRSPSWALICYPRTFPAEPERFHALARWGKQIRNQSRGRDKTTSREEAACQILVPPE